MIDDVLVVGGAGFIGHPVCAELARRSFKVTVPTRRRERAKDLTLLPTVDLVQADVNAPGVLERLMRGKQAVVNLVGVLHSRRGRASERGPNDYGPDFARAHVELPQAIVSACRTSGVRRLVHVSALGAAPQAPSQYLRSKGIGEQVVFAAEDLDVTVFRPSVVFGPQDRFLNRFAALSRFLPAIALPRAEARFQPVYVGDVAQAIASSLDDMISHGWRYELGGPREYTLRELVELVCRITGRRRWIFGLPERLGTLQAWLLEHLPGKLLSRDNLDSMKVPSVTSAPFPFGIQPRPIEAVLPSYLPPVDPFERSPALRLGAKRP
ncbi:MAG TPA: complex I NDUFA9 subunit family protein [Burkholderiales bacterium]|nr:complex I NDUFA9 subunit family protein [Burkholderiales bacterium]